MIKLNFPNIEAERARLGLTKEEMAKKLGVSTKTYYNWVRGTNPIPSDALLKLSQLCKSSIDYLLGKTSAKSINDA